MDCIRHVGLEEFKSQILAIEVNGHTIKEWTSLVSEEGESLSKLIERRIGDFLKLRLYSRW